MKLLLDENLSDRIVPQIVEPMNWLDTETKAILRKENEAKLAPPKVGEFALVLLQKGPDQERLVRAICRINECSKDEAIELASLSVPVTINSGLVETEALYGQFELICCDSVAAFIRSEVWAESAGSDYMRKLLLAVLRSAEFRSTRVEVMEVPTTEAGQKFVDQFLSKAQWSQRSEGVPLTIGVPFKKARIMKHWATRVGVRLECVVVSAAGDEAAA